MRSGSCEDADQPLARVRRAADNLHDAGAGLDLANAKLVRVRVRLGLQHPRDGEIPKLRRRVFDAFDLKTDQCELSRNLVERSVGLQVIFQPGEREFHGRAAGSKRRERQCFVTILTRKQQGAQFQTQAIRQAGESFMPAFGCRDTCWWIWWPFKCTFIGIGRL